MNPGFAIGDVQVKNRLVMAPMAGYTSSAWRRLVKRYQCGLVYSELISTYGIYFQDVRTLRYLKIKEDERPVVVQLFGAEPDIMAEAAVHAEKVADVVDLNFACPAKKVIRNGCGAALLREPKKAVEIAKAVIRKVKCPVTVKLRLGWDDSFTAEELIRALADAGIKAAAVHGRTATQYFRGTADWVAIEKIAEASPIPIIGNGDLREPVEIADRLRMTACEALMIGRAALGNPWIFEQVLHAYDTNEPPAPVSAQKIIDTVMAYAEIVAIEIGEDRAVKDLRKHLFQFFKGMPHASSLRQKLVAIDSLDELEYILLRFARQAV